MTDDTPAVRRSYTCEACSFTTPYTTLPGTCGGCGLVFDAPKDADPDRACPHQDFECIVAVARITDDDGGPVIAYTAEISVACAGCGEPFRFTGCPAGLRPDRPTVSADETTLHAPIRPASSDPDFGLGIPGFSLRYRGPHND